MTPPSLDSLISNTEAENLIHRGIPRERICAVILAGGRGARMGGVDKGLQPFLGQPLALHALNRLRSQVGGAPGLIGINANRNADEYARWGTPVWADAQGDFPGPLAGFLAAMQNAQDYDYLLTVPCDSPLFPLDLLNRLLSPLLNGEGDIAVAHALEQPPDGEPQLRSQPVFCLLPTRLHTSLMSFLEQGKRKIDAWTALHRPVAVAFNAPGDSPFAFANANTLAELKDLERL